MEIMEKRFSWLKEYSRFVSKSMSSGMQKCCSKQCKMRLSIVPSNVLLITAYVKLNYFQTREIQFCNTLNDYLCCMRDTRV